MCCRNAASIQRIDSRTIVTFITVANGIDLAAVTTTTLKCTNFFSILKELYSAYNDIGSSAVEDKYVYWASDVFIDRTVD